MTRGRTKQPKSILLSGNIYLMDIKDFVPSKGDIALSPNFNEKRVTEHFLDNVGFSGFFRLFVYDGWMWCPLKIEDFFENKENYFNKSERPIDNFYFIKSLLENFKNTTVYRTYRDHYTIYLHIPNEFKGKKGHFNKKNKRALLNS